MVSVNNLSCRTVYQQRVSAIHRVFKIVVLCTKPLKWIEIIKDYENRWLTCTGSRLNLALAAIYLLTNSLANRTVVNNDIRPSMIRCNLLHFEYNFDIANDYVVVWCFIGSDLNRSECDLILAQKAFE